jgi:hypothetical protein
MVCPSVRVAMPTFWRVPAQLSVGHATPGSRSLAAHGSLADSIAIREDVEFSEAEIDAMLDDPA